MQASAESMRDLISSKAATPAIFRAALTSVAPNERDGWLDAVLGLEAFAEDGPSLPRGCVPYMPCSVDALVRMIDHAGVRDSDVFVDVGSGIGRAAALVHLLTGAEAIGVEIQPALVEASRALSTRLNVPRLAHIEGDATQVTEHIAIGSVFFLYCPFSGERLERLLDALESIARIRPICVCCVDLALPPRPWLALDSSPSPELAIYRTRCGSLTETSTSSRAGR